MKTIKALLLVLCILGLAGKAGAEAFDFPFKSEAERQKAAAMLAKDPDFINLLVLNVFQSRLGSDPAAIMKQAGQGNMTSDNGMVKSHESPREEKRAENAVKNEPVSGMIAEASNAPGDFAVPPPDKPKNIPLPSDPSVENVDFFLSLSCDHCRRFWKTLVNDDIMKQRLLDDKLHIRVIPNSTADAGIIIIFESIKEKSPEAARDFLTWYFTGGKDSNEKAMFAGAEKWLAERGYPGLQEIHDDKDLIARIGKRVEESIALDQELDAAYPSVFVNGKQDSAYFTKVRENILKKAAEAQEQK